MEPLVHRSADDYVVGVALLKVRKHLRLDVLRLPLRLTVEIPQNAGHAVRRRRPEPQGDVSDG